MVRILFALFVGLGSMLSSAQAQTLLVLGDSLSAGYQMQVEQSWPALLNQKWQEEGANTPCSMPASAVKRPKGRWPVCPLC